MNERQLPLELLRFRPWILTLDLDPGFDDLDLPMNPDPPLYLVLPMD